MKFLGDYRDIYMMEEADGPILYIDWDGSVYQAWAKNGTLKNEKKVQYLDTREDAEKLSAEMKKMGFKVVWLTGESVIPELPSLDG